MGFDQVTLSSFTLTTIAAILCLFVTTNASPLPRPRPQQSHRFSLDDLYSAYAPAGQYAIETTGSNGNGNGGSLGGHSLGVAREQPQFIRVAGPRLIARTSNTANGTPVLRAIPASALKRVRIANPNNVQHGFIQPQDTYAIDTPVAYAQALRTASQQQEPVYYIQQNPNPVTIPQARRVAPGTARPLVRVARPQPIIQTNTANQENEEELEDEYPPDLNPQYNFSFDVKDDDLTNYQNRQEERDGSTVKGSYSVVDPDGYVRTVTYTADSKNGFQAKVTREPTDVKIKFPVPTESPEEQHQPAARPLLIRKSAGPSHRTQQFAQYPSTIAQYQQQQQQQQQPIYSQQSQLASGAYYAGAGQPTYVVRRIPVSALGSSSSSPRLVKVLRQ